MSMIPSPESLPKNHPAWHLLRNIFGFHEFRPRQEEIVAALLNNRDCFVNLPTGGGKSLCYQLPALIRDGLTVVVSPLIALMKDQVDAARELGVAAGLLNSSLAPEERYQILQDLKAGLIKLLYLSPERLALDEDLDCLNSWRVTALVVDEAHCISEWGHDFRPDYRSLSRIRDRFPSIPIAAFTATATLRVQNDVIAHMGLKDPLIVRGSFDRREIFYRVEPKREPLPRIYRFVAARKGLSGIIYRSTRDDVEKTTAWLSKHGIDALPYHAGLPDELRRDYQDRFKNDRTAVIVATVAFGMGIDKPDIRFVIHGDLPKSPEIYYQETGRAGRDGEDAEVLLLWGAADIVKNHFFIDKASDPRERERGARALSAMLRYVRSLSCRRRSLLKHFDEEHPGDCQRCDVCSGEVEKVNATVEARKFLSAVMRTGQRYGAHHAVDIVRGELTQRVQGRGHENLPTFGVGREKSRRYWLTLADDLEARGMLFRNDYKALVLTASGRELLYGREDFHSIRQAEQKKEAVHTGRLAFEEGDEKALFERLRELRYELASARKLPPYMVFPNRTLKAMAQIKPANAAALLTCPGVGEIKLDRYGEAFLRVIREESTGEKELPGD